MLTTLLLAFLVVSIALAICHLALNRRLVNRNRDGQGRGCVQGGCGDTVEIRLRFDGDRAVEAVCRSDGCAHSLLCLRSAAALAEGRRIRQILALCPVDIERALGGAADADHHHCAAMAVEALQAAVADFRRRQAPSAQD
jgi:nitrogen fixation NifU-like protein